MIISGWAVGNEKSSLLQQWMVERWKSRKLSQAETAIRGFMVGDKEMTQRLREYLGLAEDHSSILSTHMRVHKHL